MSEAGAGDNGLAKLPEAARLAADAATAAKNHGNEALKSADLPRAIERYEEAVRLVDIALEGAPQERLLRNNEIVRYGDGKFAMIDTAYPQFEDYVLMDLASRDLIKHKVGRHDFDMVSKRFLRKEMHLVPQEIFDLRLACLQNISLAALKMARGSTLRQDYEEAVKRANDALVMDGKSAKALMRKGQALVDIKEWPKAAQVLVAAAQETKGKDPEVMRLLEVVMAAKGKGTGKGKGLGKDGKGKGANAAGSQKKAVSCSFCQDPSCQDEACSRRPDSEEDSDDEALRSIKESDWKPVEGDDPIAEALKAATRDDATAVGGASSSSSAPAGDDAATIGASAGCEAQRGAKAGKRSICEKASRRQCLLISGFLLGALFMAAAVVLFLMPTFLRHSRAGAEGGGGGGGEYEL